MRRAPAAFALVLCAATGSAAPPAAPRLPAPATRAYVRGAREAVNARCEACHGRVATEHRGSLHSASFSDPSFQRGYAIEPSPFCRSCHAPEHAPDAEPDAFARSHGVACVTCHLPDERGAVLAGPARASGAAPPHPVVRVPDLGTRACASCHEFAFPNASALGDRGLMQKTVSEHAASPSRDRSCAACHMDTDARGRRTHRFTASRDPRLLASSIDVVASRAGGRATFVLTARGVGHAFPTGDLFRRLVLRVTTPRGILERALGRSFRALRDVAGRTVRFESSDGRLAPARRIDLPIGPDAARWEIVYQRVTAVSQSLPFGATVEAEIRLAAGDL